MWSSDLAYMIKLFLWLDLENKILTWDILRKRGSQSLIIYSLWCRDKETALHLFVNFPFTHHLCKFLYTFFSLVSPWRCNSLTNCLDNSLKMENFYITLPSLECWYIWLERNKCLFESHTPTIQGDWH